MSIAMLIARLLHVLLGAFWAGALIFNAVFLAPAMGEAGPDGAKVMAGITRRRFMTVMPMVALTTILTGLWLYWRVSGGFDPHWSRTPTGMAYGIGGLLAIVAFLMGIGVLRPTMMRITALAATVAQAPESDRPTLATELGTLRRRAQTAGQVVAWLLVFATTLMAVARYL
jgi:uncharacterized membrane protein